MLKIKRLTIIVILAFIFSGAAFYVYNLRQTRSIFIENATLDSELALIQKIQINFFNAVKNNRGYHIKQLPLYIQNYDSLKLEIDSELNRFKEYKQFPTEQQRLFYSLDSIIQLRFTQLDSNLYWLKTEAPDVAIAKINALEPEVQKSIDFVERTFTSLENELKQLIQDRQTQNTSIWRKNNIIFFTWLGISLLLILWFFYKVNKKSKALKQSEERFRGILNSTISFIALLKPDGTIIHINQAALNFVELKREEVKYQKLWKGYWWRNNKTAQKELHQHIQKVAQGETITYETTILDKNNDEETLLFSLKPILDEQGKITNIIAEGRSIQELYEKQKELLRKNEELEQFAYVTSHDLQEPLRMVTSFLTQLEAKYGDTLDDKAKKYIFFAVDGAKRMRQIILDLLEFSRVGKDLDNIEQVNINEIINNVCQLERKHIEEKNATINYKELPTITSYRSPLTQVFANLIGNSLKYCKTDTPPEITIQALKLSKFWQFSISDNGIGIDPEYFDKIFVVFQRLHNAEEYNGTGIGLSLVKKVIENMRGKIWLESTPNKGTTFYFTIPHKPII